MTEKCRVQLPGPNTVHVVEFACPTADALRAENERLDRANVGLVADLADIAYQRDQALAENERLRASLEKIEAGYGCSISAAEMASIARAAL